MINGSDGGFSVARVYGVYICTHWTASPESIMLVDPTKRADPRPSTSALS